MIISNEKPPIYDDCLRVFGDVVNGAIFCYGETLYNPHNFQITKHLEVHEETHSKQQFAMGVEIWWEKYLKDKKFRLSQEIPAYQNQFKYIFDTKNRFKAEQWLDKLATDLSGPLYGNLVSYDEAVELIQNK